MSSVHGEGNGGGWGGGYFSLYEGSSNKFLLNGGGLVCSR